jgi:uncharacterized protein (TIGR02588 family)
MSQDENEATSERADDGSAPTDSQPVGWLEKAATTSSGLLVAGLLGILGWDAVHTNTPPSFTTEYSPITVMSGAYRAPVTVRNDGDESAKSVIVHLELMAGDSALAESDLTIDWLAGHSSHKVIGFFERVSAGRAPTGIRAVVRGYAMP